jgi:hypothetical protein
MRSPDFSIEGKGGHRRGAAAKLPKLLRQRLNARVLSVFLLTCRDTFVHTWSLTEDAMRAPVLHAPIFA